MLRFNAYLHLDLYVVDMTKSTDLYKPIIRYIYIHIILLIRTYLSNVELCMARGLCLRVHFETNILRNVIAVYVYPC